MQNDRSAFPSMQWIAERTRSRRETGRPRSHPGSVNCQLSIPRCVIGAVLLLRARLNVVALAETHDFRDFGIGDDVDPIALVGPKLQALPDDRANPLRRDPAFILFSVPVHEPA